MSKSIITFTYSATKLLLHPCKEVFGPFLMGKRVEELYTVQFTKNKQTEGIRS